jgi:hypothetical protein
MKAYWGSGDSSIHSFTSVLDGGEWSASRPCRFTPRETAPVTHWIGGWVSPRAVLDAVVKRKMPSPRRESKPRTPIVQPQRLNVKFSLCLTKHHAMKTYRGVEV